MTIFRYVKLICISVLVLSAVLIFVFALFPSHIRISRVVNVSAPADHVAGLIADLSTWEQWNEMTRGAALTHKEVSAPSHGEGAYIRADQTILMISRSSRDSVEFLWKLHDHALHGGFNVIALTAQASTVEWYFDLHFKWYPWEKLSSMFYDKQMGPLMEKSLISLRSYAENH